MISLSYTATSGRRPGECSEQWLTTSDCAHALPGLLLLLRVEVAAIVLGAEVEAQPPILAVRFRTLAPGLAAEAAMVAKVVKMAKVE